MRSTMTMSGRIITEVSGTPSIEDIALALSRMPRFGGHTYGTWTVLQHSMVAYSLARKTIPGPYNDYESLARMRVFAMLHDAHEAITGDVPTPWKYADLKAFQAVLDQRLWLVMGLWPTFEEQSQIAEIDRRALYAEAEVHVPPKLRATFAWPKGDPEAVHVVQMYTAINPIELRGVFDSRLREALRIAGTSEREIEAMSGQPLP